MAKSGNLLTMLGLTKAEEDLDLAWVRQRSHLVLATHCPNAAESRETPSRVGGRSLLGVTDGTPEHSLSWHLLQHKENPQEGLGASTFLMLPQSPREFDAEESSRLPPQEE